MSSTTVHLSLPGQAAAESAARVMLRSRLLAQYTERPGEILRTFLSPAMDDVHRAMRPWMEAAGMEVTVDRAGNLRGVYTASVGPSAPRLLIGSHLDTVPNAGAYDGVLGVLLGLALVEAAGRRFPFSVEVIGFSDEEGTRFGVPFLGSRAVVSELKGSLLECVDANDISVAEALRRFQEHRPEKVDTDLSPHSAAYLEFHIEQGPVLEARNLALGIVDGLAGQSRCHITFHGTAGHAGTVPMELRHDALVAAAEWITHVESIARGSGGLVATVGQIHTEPGAVNVIPGIVKCSLDVRHAQDSVREAAVREMREAAHAAGLRRGVAVAAEPYHEQPAVRLDADLVNLAEGAATRAGYPTIRMTSGAGHDAMVIAPHVPAAMIFLRNPGGISHHPDESVAEQDVAAALHTGLAFLEELAVYLETKEKRNGA